MNNNKSLTKNPLGIIALFVSLIYGFACLVLSSSINNLVCSCERLPLIYFIIIFPIIILIAFLYLVVKHHTKLYAPSDFRNDDSFIQVYEKSGNGMKLINEILELNNAAQSTEIETSIQPEPGEKPSTENKTVEYGQKPQETYSTLAEKIDAIFIEKYKQAEEWAINDLSLKYKIQFKQNVALTINDKIIELDGYGFDSENTYVIEAKYWESNKSVQKLLLSLQEFLNRNKFIETNFKSKSNFKFIFAIVFDKINEQSKNKIIEFFNHRKDSISIEFFEYQTLHNSYYN